MSLDFLSFGAGDFPFKTPFKKVAISHAVARSSIVFCNSISRCRSVMAASKLLGAAAACVILLSFAAGHRKSYWGGCIKAAIIVCEQIFPILALEIFLVKFPFKSASKYFFFALAPGSGFGAAISALTMNQKVFSMQKRLCAKACCAKSILRVKAFCV